MGGYVKRVLNHHYIKAKWTLNTSMFSRRIHAVISNAFLIKALLFIFTFISMIIFVSDNLSHLIKKYENITDVHSLWFRFYAEEDTMISIDWFRFR